MMVLSRLVCIFAMVAASVEAFQSPHIDRSNQGYRFARHMEMKAAKISVMVNGMPGPMALEVAKACLDRGFNLLPMGFTGPNQPDHITVQGLNTFVDVELVAGPGISDTAGKALSILKELHPNLVIVDYTHPSAILNNLACYVENDCDFVMGTTGGDSVQMMEIFNKGKNKAVIAPNMAKQIVALQAALQEMATRFPKSFADYKLTVRIFVLCIHQDLLLWQLVPLE
jgi:4-hydroxy-tetrahydrodipicolinate reductase